MRKKIYVIPPPQGVNGAPYVPKLYASSGIDISKYICVCVCVRAVTNAFPCNECIFFKCI